LHHSPSRVSYDPQNPEQWQALFDQHKASGLTQTEFAKQQGIDPSYFSLRKRQLLAWQQDDNGLGLKAANFVCFLGARVIVIVMRSVVSRALSQR
jgi:hypothetical protein